MLIIIPWQSLTKEVRMSGYSLMGDISRQVGCTFLMMMMLVDDDDDDKMMRIRDFHKDDDDDDKKEDFLI